MTVRAAQLAAIRNRWSAISRASRLDVLHHVRPGTGQADVSGVQPEALHQMEDAKLFVDGRTADGRRLQAVAQASRH